MKRLLLMIGLSLTSGCALKAKPHDIDCAQSTIAKYSVPLLRSDLIDQIQRDSGNDFGSTAVPGKPEKGNFEEFELEPIGGKRSKLADDPIFKALGGKPSPLNDLFKSGPGFKMTGPAGSKPSPAGTLTERQQVGAEKNALLLSGGGEWGAFGAGFLRQLHEGPTSRQLPDFDVVTGVSTGAIQSLYVVAGDFQGLDNQYREPKPLSIKGGLKSVIDTGALSDTQPLRERLEAALCDKPGDCPMLKKIAESKTLLLIGMVETSTGRFVAVNISALAADAYSDQTPGKQRHIEATAKCVLGVTLASAAVPVQLRPVRLHDPETGQYHAYTDGGVRLSVFEADLAEKAAAAAESSDTKTSLWVLRNGPTVVRPSKSVATKGMSAVDAKPSADNVGLMSYSTLVNQNEVMSIASLRLVHKIGTIHVATADGYHTKQDWRTTKLCEKASWKPASKTEEKVANDEDAFDHDFMVCIADYGKEKAQKHPAPWIDLGS